MRPWCQDKKLLLDVGVVFGVIIGVGSGSGLVVKVCGEGVNRFPQSWQKLALSSLISEQYAHLFIDVPLLGKFLL